MARVFMKGREAIAEAAGKSRMQILCRIPDHSAERDSGVFLQEECRM